MHVDEAFASQACIKLEIVSGRGESRLFEVNPDLAVDKLKIMALGSLMGHTDPLLSIKQAAGYKLVSLSKKKTLNETATLRDELIGSGDIVLLLARYPVPSESEVKAREALNRGRAPTEQEVVAATTGLPEKNMDREDGSERTTPLEFPRELRKILVSLIAFTAHLLRDHPEVQPILATRRSNEEVAASQQAAEDAGIVREALQQLIDMGFPTERSKRALKLNNMSPLEAMDWLLAYESTSLFAQAGSSGPSALIASNQANAGTQKQGTSAGLSSEPPKIRKSTDEETYDQVPPIVECYRIYKRKQLRPNGKAYANLKQMGFEEEEVLDALWIHSNNEISACEWLLSDRRPKLDDLRRGLKVDSPILKSLIGNATVQLGLTKPKIFFAFLQLLEEPNSTGRWLNEPDVSPILSQIFRTYHAEKHAASDNIAVTSSSPIQSQFITHI